MDQFARIVVENVLTFAYCDESQVDEDFAVDQLERIASQLQSADVEVVNQFVRMVRMMEQEARGQGLEERAEQLASMPKHLGIEPTGG